VESRFTNTSHHEQIGSRTNFLNKKTSWVTNGVSSNKHASRQQRLATSWEYRRESVSCCVTFAQYTSLLKFTVPSRFFVFFYILLNSFDLQTFRVTNGPQERIKFVNQGSIVVCFLTCRPRGIVKRTQFGNRLCFWSQVTVKRHILS
jgi:hypothetical protein